MRFYIFEKIYFWLVVKDHPGELDIKQFINTQKDKPKMNTNIAIILTS